VLVITLHLHPTGLKIASKTEINERTNETNPQGSSSYKRKKRARQFGVNAASWGRKEPADSNNHQSQTHHMRGKVRESGKRMDAMLMLFSANAKKVIRLCIGRKLWCFS